MNPATAALAGLAALAVAMGIGRFALTPLLPMMLADGVVDLHAASWLATANYIGYLTGALLCAFEPAIRARLPRLPRVADPTMIHAGLVATGLLAMAAREQARPPRGTVPPGEGVCEHSHRQAPLPI